MSQNLSSAAVVIGALWVNFQASPEQKVDTPRQSIMIYVSFKLSIEYYINDMTCKACD